MIAPLLRPAELEEELDRRALDEIDGVVTGLLRRKATDDGAFAGAILLVALGDRVVKHTAYGYAELFDIRGERLPRPRPMRPDTLFDLASITKVVVTTTLLALLFEEGALAPTDPIAAFLPAFDRPDKREITLADALSHSSGLAAWLPFYLYIDGAEEALALIAELPTLFPRGHARAYSDVNFVVLGKVVEALTAAPLDLIAQERIFGPLGLTRMGYCPPPEERGGAVATSLGNPMEMRMCAERTFPRPPPRRPDDLPGWRRHVLVGEVNDANCHLVFGGVSGHAGLFSTAWELACFARSVLAPLTSGRETLLRRETIEHFTTPKVTPGQALGWWSQRVDASPRSFGHRGFVGTQILLDPDHDLVLVLLANRVHTALPYADPARFTPPVVRAVYRAIGVASATSVDRWLD